MKVLYFSTEPKKGFAKKGSGRGWNSEPWKWLWKLFNIWKSNKFPSLIHLQFLPFMWNACLTFLFTAANRAFGSFDLWTRICTRIRTLRRRLLQIQVSSKCRWSTANRYHNRCSFDPPYSRGNYIWLLSSSN